MNWGILLYLLCPVTMIFCMGSMFRPKKRQGAPTISDVSPDTANELKELQLQMADLMVENHRLKGEPEKEFTESFSRNTATTITHGEKVQNVQHGVA